MKAGRYTSDDINTFLATAEFVMPTGQLTFSASGEAAAAKVYVYQVIGGRTEYLGPADEAKVMTADPAPTPFLQQEFDAGGRHGPKYAKVT